MTSISAEKEEKKRLKQLKKEEKRLKKLEKEKRRQLKEAKKSSSATAAADQPPTVEESIIKDKKKRKHDESEDSKKKDKKKSKPESNEQDQKTTQEPSATANDNDEKLNAWFKEHDIEIEDSFTQQKWRPYMTFQETRLSANVLHATKSYQNPTPIQSTCFPIAMSGRDIIGIAETGSGKTMAFGIPAMSFLEKNPALLRSRDPVVLVLAPTRELALQIHEQIEKAGEKMNVKSMVIFGGVPKYEQKNALKAGVQVVIACPGRLLDLVDEGVCKLGNIKFVVLDEADRMLDMGFEKEVRRILSMTGTPRQTLMFSATWPTSIQKLASEFLKNPVKVTVGSPDLGASVNVTQIVEVLQDPRDKEGKLLQLLQKYHSSRKNRILVFALYKKEAARLESFLNSRGWKCIAIHGDMNQNERNRNFYQFKNGEVPLLIATDVAARGLDIPDVEYVINVTFPLTIEDYVHRIGRTGRAGKKGTAYTFFTVQEKAKSGELINLLKQTNQAVPDSLMAFGTTVKKKEHSAYGAFFKEVDTNVKATKITFNSDDDEE